MENKPKVAVNEFLKTEVLITENRLFWGRILASSIGYLFITLWLNSIRATAALWIVWVLIIIQFALYFSIFIAGYRRSIVFGLNKNLAWIIFIILAVLGRVNDWELIIIPGLVIVMLVFSARNKTLSVLGQNILPRNGTPESKRSDSEITNQRAMAKTLFERDRELAIRIATGEENSPKDILSAAVYAEVCEEAENSNDLDMMMRIANSLHNSEISAEAQKFELRNPDSAIEKMKEVVNARRAAFEKREGRTVKDAIQEEVENIKKEMAESKPTGKRF
jgi:hypothetical protein